MWPGSGGSDVAGYIDTLRVDVLRWQPDFPQAMVEVFTRPGLDGAGIHTGGMHPLESTAESWTVYESSGDVEVHRVSAGGMVGDIVDVTRPTGEIIEDVVIVSSRTELTRGGPDRWIAHTVWRLLSEA